MRPNKLKNLWASGSAASNFWMCLPGGLGAEIVAHQGWDSIALDMQHGQIGYEAMCAMLTALSTTDKTAVARL